MSATAMYLPDGWRQYIAPDGRKYYHHKLSKTTQWAPPPGYIPEVINVVAAAGPRGAGAHLCEHNRERTKCTECHPHAPSGQPFSGAYGVGGKEYDTATGVAQGAVQASSSKESAAPRRLGFKHAPQDWIAAHPAAHTEHYWFCLGAERQRKIREQYRASKGNAKRHGFALAPKKWVEQTPDWKKRWKEMSGDEQRKIRDTLEFQEKRPYAKAPIAWKRVPEHTEAHWDELGADVQFAILTNKQWRRFRGPRRLGVEGTARDRHQLKYVKSPLLWRAADTTKHTQEAWEALTLSEQQSIKRNVMWKPAPEGGLQHARLPVSVLPLAFYKDTPVSWRKRHTEEVPIHIPCSFN